MQDMLGAALGTLDKYVPGAKLQVSKLQDKAKAYLNNLSELEVKVHEATNHDPWGPHGTAMQGARAGRAGRCSAAAAQPDRPRRAGLPPTPPRCARHALRPPQRSPTPRSPLRASTRSW
jgi:hypothetical protein